MYEYGYKKCHESENDYNRFKMIDLKNLGLLEHILTAYWCHFHVLPLKKHALAVSDFTVTLQMMSDSRRQLSSISVVHTCTIDSSLGFVLARCRTRAWRQLLPTYPHYFELSTIRKVSVACLICPQVSINHCRWSAVITWQWTSNCLKKNWPGYYFLQ